MKSQSFPLLIKRGSVTVKIYRGVADGYESFTVAYHDGQKRKRQVFADLAKAKREADSVATKLCSGQIDVLNLTSQDRADFVHARAALEPAKVSLVVAAQEYADAVKVLGGRSIIEAARFYARRHPVDLPSKMVSDVVDELVKAKELSGRSGDYVADIRYRCGRFRDAFHCSINSVTAGQVRDFIAGLNLSARSQNNFRLSIKTLFEFAKKRGYLPHDHDEISKVEEAKEVRPEIGIFTPLEISRLLTSARMELVPFLAIGAFSGLRSAEIERLDWSEVHLEESVIEVKASKSKTGSRRLAPIPPNCARWLMLCPSRIGKVVPFVDLGDQIRTLCATTGVAWQHNGLRHSFVSYRLAEVQNANQVALEAGNSPGIIHSNYKALVTKSESAKWFAVEPGQNSDVLQFPKAV